LIYITYRTKTQDNNEKVETEKRWEQQIVSGKLPVNTALRTRNRNNFFVYMYRTAIEGKLIDLESDDFGDAKDALMLAFQIREKIGITCFVRKSQRSAAYVVKIKNVSPNRLQKYKSERDGVYEFENLAYSPTESEMSDNENYTDATLELLEPPQKSYSTGEEYERYVAVVLAQAGFTDIQMTPATGDYGADIIAVIDGIKMCIQCKMYSNPVGISAVQEIIGAKAHYKCMAAAVVTNSTFTEAAKQLAEENGVQLIENLE